MKRRRLNLIIGKKQIIIVGLTLILGVAIYINYLVGTNMASAEKDTPTVKDSNAQSIGSYGDQQFVSDIDNNGADAENLSVSDTDQYFAQARLDKEQSRAQAVETLQTIYSGGDSTDTELAVMAQNAANLSSYIESESKIENVLKAQGFEEVLCYLSDSGANIIVKTDGLSSADAAKIKNALLSEVNVPAEKISILEIK
ncbi:MAG: SpoIIIAH-like family protein [Firmicutes bacterium]|nr:SpoIIIAH-like family protein [[Eubacterium] siraeum]MCM1487388.1 SpoIIIAH-like family protein [Bacillota bacterium]